MLPGNTGTTYYVSAVGSDSNNGTSTATPWQTLAKLGGAGLFNQGDTILLRGGDTFTGHLAPANTGSTLNPITIGSYGVGRATLSQSSTSVNCIDIYDVGGFVIKDLIIVGPGAGTAANAGIAIYNDSVVGFFDFVWMQNLDVSGFLNGISCGGFDNTYGFSNVSCINCVLHDNGSYGFQTYGAAGLVNAQKSPNKNIFVHNVQAYNNTGAVGIGVGWTNTATVQYSVAYNNGTTGTSPLGIFSSESQKTTYQFCESYGNKNGSGTDGDGFDFDTGCTECLAQYCYSHDNQGCGHLLYQNTGGSPWFNNTIRFCIFQNNGTGTSNVRSEIALGSTSTSSALRANIHNNILYSVNASSNSLLFTDTGPVSGAITNNILYGAGGTNARAIDALTSTPGVTLQGNDYFGNTKFRWTNVSYTTIAAWRAAASTEVYQGVDTSLASDPQITNPGTGGNLYPAKTTTLNAYKLPGGSPMLATGQDVKLKFGSLAPALNYFGSTAANPANVGAF